MNNSLADLKAALDYTKQKLNNENLTTEERKHLMYKLDELERRVDESTNLLLGQRN